MVPPIAILGAGPAGLTLGRLLYLANIDYVIFERDESASWASGRSGSGTLDIHSGSGLLALEEAGLLAQFEALARHNVPVKIADATGKISLEVVGEGHDDRPEIDRKDLRNMLLGSIPANKVRWGLKVQSVQKDVDGFMSVHFTSGSSASGFSLVVGADGAWSKARALITPARPLYRGVTFLTTLIKPTNPYHTTAVSLAGSGMYIALGDEKSIVVARLGDESYYIGVGMRLPEEWKAVNEALLQDAEALRKALCEKYEDWSELHRDLIKYSDGGFHSWPQYSLIPEELDWVSVPGVTLIGDAAHLTVADGEGVNSAMYDSYRLSQEIIVRGLDNLNAAVVAYENQMLPRSRNRLSRSIPLLQHMFSQKAPESYINALMGKVGAD